MMYNIPHTLTGKIPFDLFFRSKFSDKIPSLGDVNTKIDYSKVGDGYYEQKDRGKECANRKKRPAEKEICIGYIVYVTNMTKCNKLNSNLDPTPLTVRSSPFRRYIINLKKVEGEWKEVQKQKSVEEEMEFEG